MSRSKEVKEAIKNLKDDCRGTELNTVVCFKTDLKTALVYVEKIEKENQGLRDDYLLLQKASESYEDKIEKELETKDKMIDLMADDYSEYQLRKSYMGEITETAYGIKSRIRNEVKDNV